MAGFSAAVTAWVRENPRRMTAVYRASVQAMAAELQTTVENGGRLPHKTGNLLRSVLASTTAMPNIVKADGEFSFVASDPAAVIMTAEVSDDIYIGYQAAYARRMNSGFVGTDNLGRTYNQEGYHFVEGARDRWTQIVMDQSVLMQGRSAGAFSR